MTVLLLSDLLDIPNLHIRATNTCSPGGILRVRLQEIAQPGLEQNGSLVDHALRNRQRRLRVIVFSMIALFVADRYSYLA